jgi:hypothetical protein
VRRIGSSRRLTSASPPCCAASLLFWTLHGRLEGLDLRSLGRTALATVMLAEAIGFYLFFHHQAGRLAFSQTIDALVVAGSAVVGGATFVVARALRSEEAEVLWRQLPRLRRAAV